MTVGGLGALHNLCAHEAELHENLFCGSSYRSEWFSVFFQLIVVLVVGIRVLVAGVDGMRCLMLVLLAMSTNRLMAHIDEALETLDIKYFLELENDSYETGVGEGQNFPFVKGSALKAYAGGLVLVAIVNFLLMVVIGFERLPDIQKNLKEILERQQHDLQPGPQPPSAPPCPPGYDPGPGCMHPEPPHSRQPFPHTGQTSPPPAAQVHQGEVATK